MAASLAGAFQEAFLLEAFLVAAVAVLAASLQPAFAVTPLEKVSAGQVVVQA